MSEKSEREPQYVEIDGRETEVVRVREVASKHEMTLTKERADQLGEAVEVLDKPAVDRNGVLLPAKPHRPKAEPSSEQSSDDDATPPEQSSRGRAASQSGRARQS